MQRKERVQKQAVEDFFVAAGVMQQVRLFHRWHKLARKCRRLHRCEYFQRTRKQLSCVRRMFSAWRCRWISVMLWKERELRIEAARAGALLELRARESDDLEKQKLKLRYSTVRTYTHLAVTITI